jgi:hypothetical protein
MKNFFSARDYDTEEIPSVSKITTTTTPTTSTTTSLFGIEVLLLLLPLGIFYSNKRRR